MRREPTRTMDSPFEFPALTAIGTFTNFVELIRVEDKYLEVIARKNEQCWLSWYPWPQRCVHDPGTEFVGPEFQTLLENCHIKDVCTSAMNPQLNAVCERMQQTTDNVQELYYIVSHLKILPLQKKL